MANDTTQVDFSLSASRDGLWLCSKISIEGKAVSKCVNLLMPDKHRLEQMLTEIWRDLISTKGD